MESSKSFSHGHPKRHSKEEYSVDEIRKLSNDVALFCLCESRHSKKIKKTAIVEQVLHGTNKQFSQIIKAAKQKLISTFGLSLLDIDDTGYIVYNTVRNTFLEPDAAVRSPDEKLEAVILKIALLAIFMNKGSMYESNLLEIIRRTGIFNTQMAHIKNSQEYLKKLLQKKFVERLLLEYKECERPSVPPPFPLPEEGKIYEYRWGARAKCDVSEEKLKEYIVDFYGTLPGSFPNDHYEDLFH